MIRGGKSIEFLAVERAMRRQLDAERIERERARRRHLFLLLGVLCWPVVALLLLGLWELLP